MSLSSESTMPAQVVLPCRDLQSTLDWFVTQIGFQLERIAPADDPREAHISGHGLQILLRRDPQEATGILRVPIQFLKDGAMVAPNGTRIEPLSSGPDYRLPPLEQEIVIGELGPTSEWIKGRAGMQYRDLIPGRLGGRFIASHIRIPEGGPVPDHVHHHGIRFQMIFCAKGWVRVAYEDQGDPIVLNEGDCFLQPPHIRHRVLESSAGLEVVEIASPGEHDTHIDHQLQLPTSKRDPMRSFGGQRFVYHQRASAPWQTESSGSLTFQDTGIRAATDDLADVRVLRSTDGGTNPKDLSHSDEFFFLFVLKGSFALEGLSGGSLDLSYGSSLALPAETPCQLKPLGQESECLMVRVP